MVPLKGGGGHYKTKGHKHQGQRLTHGIKGLGLPQKDQGQAPLSSGNPSTDAAGSPSRHAPPSPGLGATGRGIRGIPYAWHEKMYGISDPWPHSRAIAAAATSRPALSPDSISEFACGDPHAEEQNKDATDASAVLVDLLVPAMAKELLVHGHPQHREGLTLCEYLHNHGVNLRHLGLLRYHYLLQAASQYHPYSSAGSDGMTTGRSNGSSGGSSNSAFSGGAGDGGGESSCSTDNNPVRDGDSTVTIAVALSSTTFALQAEMLQEMMCRTLKKMIRSRQRVWMKNQV